MNFWEARQAALEGKRVKKVETDTEFTIDDFISDDYFSFDNYEIKAEWKLVEEPKTITVFINTYKYNGATWGIHDTKSEADDKARPGRLSCIEILTDEFGTLISARNV